MTSLCIKGRNTKAERKNLQKGSHGREWANQAEYVALQNEQLPGEEKESQCVMESLLLWDERDDESDSQTTLELRAASQMEMQKYLLREL